MGFASEDRLLIQCSRVKMDDEALVLASNMLQEDLNWDYTLEASIRHAVSPLFYHGLKQVMEIADIDHLVPARIMEQLQKLYLSNQSRNRRLYRIIGDISKAFEEAGIRCMGLKDVQLAWEVYPDIGLRPMGDIDILIHRQEYEKAAMCMADLGFVPLPNPDIPYTLKYAWAHHFHRPTDNVWVDLQWNVLQIEWDTYQEGNFDFEIDRMWRGANFMMMDDYEVLVPKPEDMLFHLCLHLEGHRYAELVLFCDIVELLRHYDGQLDWQYFVEITKRYKVESSVYYVLFLIEHLFKTILPPSLLQELEPPYFKASIFEALFGNLTTLHLSLDETRQAAFPPDEVMADFEATVRQQATSAMQLYKEIDQIASAFVDQGGCPIILDGTFSERIFPDPLLRSFEEIRFFVLRQDLPRMRQVLSNRGFRAEDVQGSEIYKKGWEITSEDPALADQRTRMLLQVNLAEELDCLFESNESENRSKKNVAQTLVKARLAGHKGIHGDIPVRLRVMALSPEDILVYFSGRLGNRQWNRLFGLNDLLEFFRCHSGPIDWQQVTSKSQRYGISSAVGEGLLIASELLDDDQLPPAVLTGLAGSASRPRVLEWARYGPASLENYTNFKSPFFFLLSFLSVDGVKAKSRYLLGSLWGRRGNKPALPGLIIEIATGMMRLLQRKQHMITEYAYWVEPEVALEIGLGNT